jgi:hypothetical protein
MRILFSCQRCGEEVGEGEQDRNGKHAYCGGTIDPIGECMEDGVLELLSEGCTDIDEVEELKG